MELFEPVGGNQVQYGRGPALDQGEQDIPGHADERWVAEPHVIRELVAAGRQVNAPVYHELYELRIDTPVEHRVSYLTG